MSELTETGATALAHRDQRRVTWRPPQEIRERLDAWAKERGGSKRGLSRAEALTRLVSQAFEVGEEALTEGAANEVLEEIGEVRTDLSGLEAKLGELRARVDALGPAVLAAEHIVAYWMSRDPANRELGETPEMLEERLVFDMNRIGSDNWSLLQEGGSPAAVPGAAELPLPLLRTGIERHLLYWESRTPGGGEVQVGPRKERRVRSWAARNGCKPQVALEALLDFALSAAGEPGVPESQVEEIKAALAQVRAAGADLRAQLETVARDVAFVGELVAGLAPLLSLLCTQDQGIRHPALGWQASVDPQDLYARLSAYIWTHAVSQWDGRVQSLLDASVPEGPPVEEEWLRPLASEDEAEGGS
jgi:hypothetical protein